MAYGREINKAIRKAGLDRSFFHIYRDNVTLSEEVLYALPDEREDYWAWHEAAQAVVPYLHKLANALTAAGVPCMRIGRDDLPGMVAVGRNTLSVHEQLVRDNID